MSIKIKEQELIRTEKIKKLQELNIAPYPSASFFTNTTAKAIADGYPTNPTTFQSIALAGRLMSKRIMGGVSFAEIQDHTGKIQIYVKRDTLCSDQDKSLYNTFFKQLLDIGDIIGIEGSAFVTKVGALAVHVQKLQLLSKAIQPLPVVKEVQESEETKLYYTFSNPEHRYRQRYLDLILNPQNRDIFRQRARIMHIMRQYFDGQDYLEVETPILQPIYGGASARPFTTHHHTLDMQLYLRISNELYLKRLIIGGYPGVYEFAKDFRNEGMSRFHNPEFTMLELYVPYKDYRWMMEETEVLLRKIVQDLHGKTHLNIGEHTIDFGKPFQRFTMFEVIQHFTKVDIREMEEGALYDFAQKLNISVSSPISKGKLIDEIFGSQCEPYLIQPTFITDYPVEMSPLAKQKADNPALVERFELICNGKELANAFSELNDPIEQKKRLQAQQRLSKLGDREAMVLDEDFIHALKYGMPPTAGIGIGIDRLTMLMTNQSSIQEVIFFPQMRNQK